MTNTTQPSGYVSVIWYGKKYNCEEYECKTVALIYPQTKNFTEQIRYQFDQELALICFPFNVDTPEDSVKEIINRL